MEEFLPEKFNTKMIAIGSAMPDIAPHRRVHSHNPARAIKEWKAFLGFVNRTRYTESLLSYAAGIMSHYISDNFCYAHNFYNIQVKKHRVYEVIMQQEIESIVNAEIDLKEVFKNWQLLQAKGIETYLTLKNETYQQEVQKIETDKERMIYDVRNSILNSAVWMLEIAYVVSPSVVMRTSMQFA